MKNILIIDDDVHLRALVKTYAELEGYHCLEAANYDQAISQVEQTNFDIIVLDVMMPGKDGFETLAEIRKFTECPVIMLSARKEEYDKLLGFNLGADDYVPKPFSPKELMARIKAVLKRSGQSEDSPNIFGGLEIKEKSHAVTIDGTPLVLTPKEFDLLIYLAKNDQICLDRETILKNVWGYNYYGDTRTVDTHIKSLRDRLGNYRDLITTVWGVGYKFEYDENKITQELP
ncbi:response regulator transcription factor [Enterococcus sp. 669A]|uniref:Response regulator transcription factor n=1 Tax=Candidatus Enterococcus moelleringii TaxID=2815325 RepID=A0ABS3LCR2_9ENTE|nr:response regulator transcription factor [Enterococcus sp. 669A]MBO1307422.1 response regulator transcription factor [Enterococcus sp. 669A]